MTCVQVMIEPFWLVCFCCETGSHLNVWLAWNSLCRWARLLLNSQRSSCLCYLCPTASASQELCLKVHTTLTVLWIINFRVEFPGIDYKINTDRPWTPMDQTPGLSITNLLCKDSGRKKFKKCGQFWTSHLNPLPYKSQHIQGVSSKTTKSN